MSRKLSEEFSGVILNQNVIPGPADFRAADTTWINQEFFLPDDYLRGTDSGELSYPDITGFQFCVEVPQGTEKATAFDWMLQYRVFGADWITADSGTAVGAPTYGARVWMTVYFNKLISADADKQNIRWRIAFKGNGNTVGSEYGAVVPYNASTGRATVAGNAIDHKLVAGVPYAFDLNGVPSVLIYDASDKVARYYVQQGPTKFWYSTPNPLAASTAYARAADGITQLGNYSFLFRILGLVAEEGIDFLGNRYRSVVVCSEPNNASTVDGANKDRYWLSKPNPSRFAVENLYFDLRAIPPTTFDESGDPLPATVTDVPVVIDRILLDPLTPNMYFHVYYTDEGDAGVSEDDWNSKLWKIVPKSFQAKRREVHVLPEPISAKFVKVEFSHLQARHYSPGDFARPITYIKHPKWVLDYFLARLDAQQRLELNLGVRKTGVIYDALDIAYNYYLDDLNQEPDQPVQAGNTGVVTTFLSNRDDLSDQVDPSVLAQINLVMQPYANDPGAFAKNTYLLGLVAQQRAASEGVDASLERGSIPGTPQFYDVQALRSREVAFENDMPIMFFYLTCRHGYRVITGEFSHDRAYFAGVNEIAFTRENYTAAHDNQQYTEPGADLQNIERNDFTSVDGVWTV